MRCPVDPDQLYELSSDPLETSNLAGDPAAAEIERKLAGFTAERWDIDAFNADVCRAKGRRHIGCEALRNGAYYPWDFQPLQKASERYMRNHMDLNVLEASARFPRQEE